MVKVEIRNLTVRYGTHTVVKDFSLDVNEGEILGIVGPSGCGKTTILRALGGFINAEQGEIAINGNLVYSAEKRVNRPPETRQLGIVFQDYAVWPHLSVWDNVRYPLKKRRVPKHEAEEMVKAALEQVQMTGYEQHMPSQLSGGQQQRVAIARALTCSSDLLLMDEPITNLDAKLREGMLDEIRHLQKELNATILYITHDQEAALHLCDRVVIMDQEGNISQTGSDEEIIQHPANQFVFSFIGASSFIPVVEKNGKYYVWEEKEGLCYSDSLPAGYVKGLENVMGIRPLDILFDDASPVKAVISHATFLGSMFVYFVRLGQRELRVHRSTLDSLDGREYKEGETVGLRFVNEKYYQPGQVGERV